MWVDHGLYCCSFVAGPALWQVSLSVRLAVGMTEAQVADGTDVMLARWLSEPSTAQAVARMYAPDAVIQWLHTPEIWYQRVRLLKCGKCGLLLCQLLDCRDTVDIQAHGASFRWVVLTAQLVGDRQSRHVVVLCMVWFQRVLQCLWLHMRTASLRKLERRMGAPSCLCLAGADSTTHTFSCGGGWRSSGRCSVPL